MSEMKFRFKIQKYQTEAVEAVTDVFNGQPRINAFTYTLDRGIFKKGQIENISIINDDLEAINYDDDDDIGYANAPLNLSDEKLLENIRIIQSKSNIEESTSLVKTNGLGRVSIDVEMETGTGKTYVYTKTMFELNKKYGRNKFIVVVPSIAIREGIRKSFEMTQIHFMDTYGQKLRFFIYDSNHLDKIDSYSKDNKINVMIINIQAFNTSFKEGGKAKESRIIYSIRDDFQGRKPIDVIAKNRPIIIMDEPQKMGGEATQNALRNFNPLFLINYSATHRVQHNLVYALDAIDAYNQKLVKKIEVKGFTMKNLRGTNAYLYLSKIITSPKDPPKALIEVEIGYNKSVNRETRYFNKGDNIYETSKHLEEYKNYYIISEIDPLKNTVTLFNGIVLEAGKAYGDVSELDIRRIQIRETIKSHFQKEEEMFNKGIKVLSLFFIDEVAKYRQYDEDGNPQLGIYGQIFEEEYNKELSKHLNLLNKPYYDYLESIATEKTHQGYFSIDKKGHMVDSSLKRNSDESDDISAYDLILKNKERLLSFDEPTRFIFSHSALREGWDNPNVFQICTLKYSSNDVQRHQEVGRGLRLCVNQNGERMDATVPGISVHDINKLTVIANEAYEDFVNGLQNQIKANLFDRPSFIDTNYFKGRKVNSNDGKENVTLSNEFANKIYFYLVRNNYVDEKGKVTDIYKNDQNNNSLVELSDDLKPFSESIHKLIQRSYQSIEIDDGNEAVIDSNDLNNNFKKEEFQELWKAINHQYVYKVEFDSNELIRNAVKSINANLNVTKLLYTVSTGEQHNEITREEINDNSAFKTAKTHTDTIESFANDNIEYDLIGKIKEKTNLTRKTIAEILHQISPQKFSYFKLNPEEFINKTSKLINDEKASIIIEHVSYTETDEVPFSTDIFTQEKSKSEFLKAFRAKKGVQDYIFTDGMAEKSVEKKFAESLDNAEEVVVYAKLPRGFYIPTPVGKYSPDRAIAFKKGTTKHVYFIAETKGSMDSLQLRGIEKAKIECAKKLFNSISSADVSYGKVDSYDELISVLKN